jgi:hypothetical protein
MRRTWYGMSPTVGSTATERIFSGVRAATSSISMPPSVEAMIASDSLARSSTMPR